MRSSGLPAPSTVWTSPSRRSLSKSLDQLTSSRRRRTRSKRLVPTSPFRLVSSSSLSYSPNSFSSLAFLSQNRWGASAELGRFNFTPFDGSTLISVFSTPSNPTTPKLVFEALTTPCSLSVLLSPISSLLRTQGSRIWRGFGAEIIAGTIQACWVEQRSVSGSIGKEGDIGEEKVEGKELWCLGCAVEDGTLVWGDARMR